MRAKMKLKRSNFVLSISSVAMNMYYHFTKNRLVLGAENIPQDGPALLLPKHQKMSDITLEGVILHYQCKRPGNWIMRHNLPDYLRLWGGIKVVRPDDIKREQDREKRKELFQVARDYNQAAVEYVAWLYQQNELVVLHPEGTRSPKKMGKVRSDFLRFSREANEKAGINVPAIPIGIHYSKVDKYFCDIVVRIGEPIDIQRTDLVQVVTSEIKKLSGL
jgi:1-acyl-sn-glycerol-3-phosphate acyltransferase